METRGSRVRGLERRGGAELAGRGEWLGAAAADPGGEGRMSPAGQLGALLGAREDRNLRFWRAEK